MTRRITVSSPKGGVGKTTVALNLALAFAERGQRTLLVDTDPQGGIGHSLAQGDTELPGLSDAMMGACGPAEAIRPTKLRALSLLPRGRLSPVDAAEFELAIGTTGALDDVLCAVERDFDLVVVDTPSGVGLVTRSVLRIADFVLLPFQAEPLALRSLVQALEVIRHVRAHENPKLELLGILPTMVERTKDPSHQVMMEIWSGFEGVLDTAVPRADVFTVASQRGLPVAFLGGVPSPEARRFDGLASELAEIMNRLRPTQEGEAPRAERALL